jgi:ankyrin repeat protein
MHRQIITGCALVLAIFNYAWTEEKVMPVTEPELRAASAKAIKLIQYSQADWAKKETCTSCHHQLLTEFPINLARQRQVALDEKVARETTAAAFAYFKDLDGAIQNYDYIDIFFDGWALVTAHAAGLRPSLSTAAFAQFIASHQLPDGSWRTIDGRPPQAHSPFAATAVCVQAVQYYLPQRLKDEKEIRVRRAREWFLKTQPRTTEDKTFHLFGLSWTGADDVARKKAAKQLLAEQREDGGWSQLPWLDSDAYATGEVLVALHEGAGLPTADPAYQRGLRYLLRTQQPDGSWKVKSRLHPPAPVSPPYFETGFPHQKDQFVSIMGTSWAITALLHAIPPEIGENPQRHDLPILAPAENAEWINTALNGSAAELKKLLDGGMNPDAKTAGGTTALMMAARDLEKVKLLLDRGADVNARAATGITALIVASLYRGNAEVVRLLLKKGARPNADKGIDVRNDATALFFAVTTGDVQTAGALIDAGARPGDKVKLLGRLVTSPMLYATYGGDLSMVEYLISRGANPNEIDDEGVSLLGWATINNHVRTVQSLLARGAQINKVDNLGMTPLLYAVSIDFGDTHVLEKLIAAGADLQAKNKQGLTPLDLAKNYNHTMTAKLLAAKLGLKP